MKKLLSLAVFGLVLSGCTKGFDMVEPTPEPTPNPTGVTDEEIKKHAEETLGFTIPDNQDWNTTTNGTVTINVDSSVKKVSVMALLSMTDDEGEAYTSMTVLNQAETNNQSSVVLNYDVPSKNEGLYVAFYTNKSCFYKKVDGNTVAFDQAKARTRAETDVYTYPTGDFKIGNTIDSWAAQRNWVPGEKLYTLADEDYSKLQMTAPKYSNEYNDILKNVIFSYLPNKQRNLDKIKAAGYYDDNAYRTTTGSAPIIVSPVYKCDKAKTYGNEVWNSDLYYYYFDPAKFPTTREDQIAFLEALPKYKLIPFNIHFGETEDDKLEKRTAYACLYFGDGVQEIGKKGEFLFPEGYKIGFMIRANTDFAEEKKVDGVTETKPRKQGELYFDGRLNSKINTDNNYNFSSSKLSASDPRATWFKINDRVFLCWESGTDADFNDIIMEVEGGVLDPEVSVEFEYNTYTFCFEDTQKGDYDLNDIVIKVRRINETTVEYSIVACGAYDELYVKNIKSGVIQDNVEIHSLFGKEPGQFINTQNGSEKLTPVTVQKTVSKDFSILNTNSQPYIYDKTTGLTVKVSKSGEDPHGIMIPFDFAYPTEKTCIKNAYGEFNNWGSNPVVSTNWYTKPVDGKVYSK